MPMYLDELKSSNNSMKFDIFSRKKFNCNIYDEKFKTRTDRAQAYETRSNKLTITHNDKKHL
jgi:hypothetical protein